MRAACDGCRRPLGASPLIDSVPRVAMLLASALEYGVSDVDGGLRALLQECVEWMAAWPQRAWPQRTFASMGRWVACCVPRATCQDRVYGATAAVRLGSHTQ